ncbi:hypothetical protein CYLTODRAFT_414828 [Cylindrobasidium torrendii FP15055 ss-10]|uniref:Uncharacterized protein n=1 Tax=Cylindrobasidium torrendii FP15055 ss-10 TaxID=1314674 RepID=A0A0D7AYG3_9AGAR|nr:hypothetical protein CYLTODRAFT_414828 [Cylindrobasidium torrendii FP15055 ss-10]
MDLNPATRYKKRHVLPGGVVGGPGKPKNSDSFFFPGLHHLAVLQKHGLTIWDGLTLSRFVSHPFLALVTADFVELARLVGTVGHSGKSGCRLYCPRKGRRKPGAPQYYPALLKPDGYEAVGCDHGDVQWPSILSAFTAESAVARYCENLQVVENSRLQKEHKANRLETGIVKPSIFLGLPERHRLGIPIINPGDNMHLPCLNITDLYFSLWRDQMDCDRSDDIATWDWVVLTGDVWKEHGKEVAAATPYIPGSFDRPPRNPAEKINKKYYRRYCKGVRAMRIIMQLDITMKDIEEANSLFTEFCTEFEELYIQRLTSRLHFARQSMHVPGHMAHEVRRRGPGGIYSQWVIERTIGNLGEEIRQHSNASSFLTSMIQRKTWTHSQLEHMMLVIGTVLCLRVTVLVVLCPPPAESAALTAYLSSQAVTQAHCDSVIRWARLRLPNGQTARSVWSEGDTPIKQLRASRHVKIATATGTSSAPRTSRMAEVLYFALLEVNSREEAVAVLVRKFDKPDFRVYVKSFKTYWTARKQGDEGIACISVKDIESVVMLAPDVHISHGEDYWYLMEKPGLQVASVVLGPSANVEMT